MRSPLKPLHNSLSATVLSQKIGQNKIIDSFFFFDGVYECMLAGRNNFIVGHTPTYAVEEFWSSLRTECDLIEGVCSDLLRVFNKQIFELLQDSWYQKEGAFIRSALFFLLSRHSSRALPSSGEYDPTGFNKVALTYLKKVDMDKMHVTYHADRDNFVEAIQPTRPESIIFMNLGRYSYGIGGGGGNLGIEQSPIPHRDICTKLSNMKTAWIINYAFNKDLLRSYEKFNIILVDEYGNPTDNVESSREMVIANF